MYKKIPYQTGRQLLDGFSSSDEAQALIDEELNIDDSIEALLENPNSISTWFSFLRTGCLFEAIWWGAHTLDAEMMCGLQCKAVYFNAWRLGWNRLQKNRDERASFFPASLNWIAGHLGWLKPYSGMEQAVSWLQIYPAFCPTRFYTRRQSQVTSTILRPYPIGIKPTSTIRNPLVLLSSLPKPSQSLKVTDQKNWTMALAAINGMHVCPVRTPAVPTHSPRWRANQWTRSPRFSLAICQPRRLGTCAFVSGLQIASSKAVPLCTFLLSKPAARMGDTTSHGGTIVLGMPAWWLVVKHLTFLRVSK